MSVFTNNQSIPPSNSISGWMEIADSITETVPITQDAIEGGQVSLENDGLGITSTEEFNMTGVSNPWDSATNTFNFAGSGLNVGDNIIAKIVLKVNPAVIPQKISLIYQCFSGIDGTGTLIFEFTKEIGEITSNAGIDVNYRDETRFHLLETLSNGSCKIYIEGTSRYNVKVVSFNFLIIRST